VWVDQRVDVGPKEELKEYSGSGRLTKKGTILRLIHARETRDFRGVRRRKYQQCRGKKKFRCRRKGGSQDLLGTSLGEKGVKSAVRNSWRKWGMNSFRGEQSEIIWVRYVWTLGNAVAREKRIERGRGGKKGLRGGRVPVSNKKRRLKPRIV